MTTLDTTPPAPAPNPEAMQAQRSKWLGGILWAAGKLIVAGLGLIVGVILGIVVGQATGILPFGC